jgi:hypothetical protein
VLRPQLTALQAANAAMVEYEEAWDFDPEVAAGMHADDLTDICQGLRWCRLTPG